jgi:hypothetical protein
VPSPSNLIKGIYWDFVSGGFEGMIFLTPPALPDFWWLISDNFKE